MPCPGAAGLADLPEETWKQNRHSWTAGEAAAASRKPQQSVLEAGLWKGEANALPEPSQGFGAAAKAEFCDRVGKPA